LKKVKLDRISRQAGIEVVQNQSFYAREVEVPDHIAYAIYNIDYQYTELRAWMEEQYAASTTARRHVSIPFPEHLLKKKESNAKKVKKADKVEGQSEGV
jgi:hypothetical protein